MDRETEEAAAAEDLRDSAFLAGRLDLRGAGFEAGFALFRGAGFTLFRAAGLAAFSFKRTDLALADGRLAAFFVGLGFALALVAMQSRNLYGLCQLKSRWRLVALLARLLRTVLPIAP